MHDRSAWIRGDDGPKIIRGRTYTNLVEFVRPCATCNKLFSIFVTKKIGEGGADSNSFGLKNCEEHRRNKTAAAHEETDALRMTNGVMKEELDGLYASHRELFAENQVLKARLATYELQGAMETTIRAAAGEPVDAFMAMTGGERTFQEPAKSAARNKMPWEQNNS